MNKEEKREKEEERKQVDQRRAGNQENQESEAPGLKRFRVGSEMRMVGRSHRY